MTNASATINVTCSNCGQQRLQDVGRVMVQDVDGVLDVAGDTGADVTPCVCGASADRLIMGNLYLRMDDEAQMARSSKEG